MNHGPRQHSPEEIHAIFSRLNVGDVEQFYRNYQLWLMQQQLSYLQTRIMVLQQQIAENDTHLQQLHPSPIALAALAQLQANGVNDIDLLDRMLERGEVWLDQAMQRLAYCEKFEFISDNYTEWCKHALDGAYDWIDSVQSSRSAASADEEVLPTETPLVSVDDAPASGEEITEEMLLEKLMSDEADETDPWQETTIKRPTVKLAQTEETTIAQALEVADAAMEEAKLSEINEAPVTPAEEPALTEMGASATILAAESSGVETNTGAEQAAASVVSAMEEHTQDTLAAPAVEDIQDILANSQVEAAPDIAEHAPDEKNQETAEPAPTEGESQIDASVEQVQSSNGLEHKNLEEPGVIAPLQEAQEPVDGIYIESAPEGTHADEPTDSAGAGEEVILAEYSEGTSTEAEHTGAPPPETMIKPGELRATPTTPTTPTTLTTLVPAAHFEQVEADTVSGPTQGRLSVEQQNTTPVSTPEEHAAVEIPTDESYQGEPSQQRKRGFFQRIFGIFRSH